MKRAKYITRCLATSVAVVALSLPFLAQKNDYHPPVARAQAPSHPAPNQAPHNQAPRAQAPRQPERHAGDWLRQYKDLPPREQERALQNDPHFRSLPPRKQQALRQQLRVFSNLPPRDQQRVLDLIRRQGVYHSLPPQQQQRARWVHDQMQLLPPDRRILVKNEIHDLRALPPEQREQRIDSERDEGMFSAHERDILREVARLPLAPAQNGAAPAPPE